MFRTGLRNVTALVRESYFRQVNPAPHPRDLRASDADRERVVAVLAEAASDGRLTLEEHTQRVHQAYTARTLGELARLTEDLVAPPDQPLRLDEPRTVTALFTGARREGRWVVPGRLLVTVVGGQAVLDVRDAILQSRHTVVQATLIAGQLHLLVPDGVRVVVTSARATAAGGQPSAEAGAGVGTGAGTPLIEIRAVTVGGRVRVHMPRRPGRRWRGGRRDYR
jgi:DUF1707 SHOCT-like domain